MLLTSCTDSTLEGATWQNTEIFSRVESSTFEKNHDSHDDFSLKSSAWNSFSVFATDETTVGP